MNTLLALLAVILPTPDFGPPTDVDHRRDFYCASLAVFAESRGEPVLGQVYVAASIRNRADSGRWPDFYCDVVFQSHQYVGMEIWPVPRRPWEKDPVQWAVAQAVVHLSMSRMYDDDCSRKVLYFFNPSGSKFSVPKGQRFLCSIGNHVFLGDNLQ